MAKEITAQDIAGYQDVVAHTPKSGALQNTVMKNGILASSENMASQVAMDPVFSVEIDTGSVANQKQSGRCWMFAALNTMRHPIQSQYKLKGFELSQNYTNFWDKFEKSNWFYENIITTAALPLGDRKVDFLLATPQQDGGQWDMLMALIEKYGVVPKSVMPETYNSSKSNELNATLNLKLRADAVELRKIINEGADDTQVQDTKDKMLSEVYRILVYSLGNPPTKFDWEYKNDDGEYTRDTELTPQTFFRKYVGWNTPDYISIINSPTDDKPYKHDYTVEFLGNVVGGRQVRHFNLDIDTFKALAVKQLQAGETVWFGSDVGKSSERQKGIMDTDFYHVDDLFDVDLSMTKAQRLDYGESLMTHAMVLTGVDLVNGKPTKWKVENSWGDKVGEKGYFVMSDKWFDQFVYQVVINKKFLSADLKQAFEAEFDQPKVLAPWDPMGALAL
ncbi:aminopeptidase C [Schleiferilactobacillus perolens]|uniref:aminopeptidase C n=1 Tax=Schleiferilactobacillus perolens TaxID=100468 RepID=UPI002356AA65|nr:C1 family peptidase [Schleiferilactobacillus perolens]MCI1891205.1 C1 family peptidase [Schleiferilactobacillus harbinensis]MCI1911857.1 C1 family peptidase [Schleiferilactobacillus harbinensis]MCI2171628.1 C1 family peptidase [Schleiferilactobacillus perolens]